LKQPLSRRARLWIAASVVALPIIAVLSAGVVEAARPRDCGLCHSAKQFVADTSASAHASTQCAACHVRSGITQRLSFSFGHMSKAAVAALGFPRGDRAVVSDSACKRCHANVAKGVSSARGLRIRHGVCTEGMACTDCHSITAHGESTRWIRTYEMESCLSCHVSQGTTECDTCHANREAVDRVSSGVFAATHGKQWRTTHGMGKANTCAVCHTATKCEKCHGPGLPHEPDFITTHKETAVLKEARCKGCHETVFCDSCHGTPMPHSRKFTRSHAKAVAKDRRVCDRCHIASDCEICHLKHVHPGGAVDLNAPVGGSAPATGTGAGAP